MPAAPRPEPKIPPDTFKSLAGGGGGVPELKTGVIKTVFYLILTSPRETYYIPLLLFYRETSSKVPARDSTAKKKQKRDPKSRSISPYFPNLPQCKNQGRLLFNIQIPGHHPRMTELKLPGEKPGNMFNKHPR